MAADGTATRTAPPTPVAALPEQRWGHSGVSPTERIVRQVDAVDAWVAGRRKREVDLQAGMSRTERMEAARDLEALRRTDDTIKRRCARGLDAEVGPMRMPGMTAVIAHRHAWFVDRLALLLGSHGVSVLACTDNGAEALGVVVAEQPDIVLAGDRLAMMAGRLLLAEVRLYAPFTVLGVQASDPDQADALRAGVDSVFLRHHPPAVIAEALVALHLRGSGVPAGA